MEIKFLGTGSGKTSLKRFHSSLFFSSDTYNLVVDAGDGISKSLLSQKIPCNFINGILISHLHPDHFGGLSSLIVQMKLHKRINDLDIFIHKSLLETVKKTLYQSYIFNEKLNFKINYIEFNNDEQIKVSENFNFVSKQNSHLDSYKLYDHVKSLSFSCSSFLFNCMRTKIFYTGDIGDAKDLFLFSNDEIDLLISEISHVSLSDIYDASIKLGINKIYLTHLSDEDEETIAEFFSSLTPIERGKIVVTYDGMTLNI